MTGTARTDAVSGALVLPKIRNSRRAPVLFRQAGPAPSSPAPPPSTPAQLFGPLSSLPVTQPLLASITWADRLSRFSPLYQAQLQAWSISRSKQLSDRTLSDMTSAACAESASAAFIRYPKRAQTLQGELPMVPKREPGPLSASLLLRLAEAADGFRDGAPRWFLIARKPPHQVTPFESEDEANAALKKKRPAGAHLVLGPY